ASLSALEVEDLVTLRDVVSVLQRTEMVRRIADEIEIDVIELGVDGRLIMLQLEELLGGVYEDGRQVVRDYFHEQADWQLGEAMAEASRMPGDGVDLARSVTPRGYRLLSKVPRLPESVVDNIVQRFGNLQKIMRATSADLEQVEGVGAARAKAIKEGLARLAE